MSAKVMDVMTTVRPLSGPAVDDRAGPLFGGRDEHHARHRERQRLRIAGRWDNGRDPARPDGSTCLRSGRCMRGCPPDHSYLRFFSRQPALRGARGRRAVRRAPGPTTPRCWRCAAARSSASPAMRSAASGPEAKIAFAVPDDMHGTGHRHPAARAAGVGRAPPGITTFTAPVLTENTEMQQGLQADAGLSARRQPEDGVIEFACDLPRDDSRSALGALPGRGRQTRSAAPTWPACGTCSSRVRWRLSAPAGGWERSAAPSCTTSSPAGTRARSTRSTRTPTHMEGVPCLPSVSALPEPVDLAVVAVPPPPCQPSPTSAAGAASRPWW